MASVYDNIKDTNVIDIPQGSTYSDTVTLANTDLTGYIVTSQLRKLDGTLAYDFTVTNDAPLTGVVTRSLTPVQTKTLTPCLVPGYVWGLQFETPTGDILREVQGGATVTAEVVYD